MHYRRKTGIRRSRAYGQSLIPIVWRIVIRFPRAAVALPFVAPIFWTGSKISQIASLVSDALARWYLFSIQQFRGIYRLVRYLHPPFVDKVCRYMQQGQILCRSRVHSGVMSGTTRNRFNGVWRSTTGEGLLVCPDKVYGTYFSYSDHRRNCTRA